MSTPRETRLVLYVSAELAAEVRRLAALDGRTVSNWLSRLVATAAEQTPTPPAADVGGEGPAHEPALPSRRARDDPEYAPWLKSHGG